MQYRAGDVVLPATGTLAADSGKSIFLEERISQRGQIKSFRWEIPYVCIMSLEENFGPAPVIPDEASTGNSKSSDGSKASIAPLQNRHTEA